MFTWKRITAKTLMLLVLLVAIFPSFSPSIAATYATGVETVRVSNDQDIYEGDEFTVTVYLNGTAQRVSLEDQTNFKSTDGSNVWTSSSGSSAWTFRLISMGKENELKLKITPFIGNSSLEFSETISIPGFKKSTGSNSAVDTFKVNSKSVRELIAGTTTTIEVPVEVQNTSAIKNVTMTLVRDDTLFMADGTDYTTTIASISKSTPTTALFNVKINPSAKSKSYDVKFQFRYTTASGTTFMDDTNNIYTVRVKSAQMEPNVNVTDYKMPVQRIAANATQKLTLTLENSGTINANDIRIKLSGFDKDKLRLSSDVDTKRVDNLAGKQTTTVTYNIAAAPGAKTESNELVADISYIDDNGNAYKTTSKVYVQVEGTDISSIDLAVTNLKYAERVKSKGSFNIGFDLKNNGKTEARMVEVSVEYPNATLTPKTTPKKIVRTFAPGQVQHFNFELAAKEEAQTGFADVYINVKYNVEGGKDADALTIREFAGVFVEGSQGLGRPKVIIENYNFGGTTVLSGQEFDLYLDLFNTSSEEAIKNIKVSLKADDGVFAPVDMSSSFFIERIEAQGRETKVVRMKTKNDAQVKGYNIVVTFQYEDSKGNAYDAQKNPFKEEETITIPVNQPVRIETGEPSFNPEIYLNQPTPVSLEFFNMGRSTVYNLMVKAEGDFQIQGSNYFVGNFEPGRSDFFETQVMPTVEGTAQGKIIFIYEDANGVPGQFEKPFSMNVMAMPVDPGTNPDGQNPDGSVDPNVPTGPMPHAKLIIAGILTGIGAIFGGVIIWKRRLEKAKSLKQEDFDE